MKKSELINKLNKIEGDYELLFMVDSDLLCDEFPWMKGESVQVEKCIEAEYNEEIHTNDCSLAEAIECDIDNGNLSDEDLQKEVDKIIDEIKIDDAIRIEIGT